MAACQCANPQCASGALHSPELVCTTGDELIRRCSKAGHSPSHTLNTRGPTLAPACQRGTRGVKGEAYD
eukprot:7551202-Alexandrium_andersonii.AAC.1